jgi:DNA-binding response OmpR family regulator
VQRDAQRTRRRELARVADFPLRELASAVVLARDFHPQVALLDLAMPRTNGFDLQKQLRAIDSSRTMTIAAITGLGQTQTRRQALDAGFDQFMVKPVAIQNLVELFGQVPRR